MWGKIPKKLQKIKYITNDTYYSFKISIMNLFADEII